MSETAPEFTPPGPNRGPMGIDTKWWIIGGVVAAGVVYYAYKRSAGSSGTPGTDPSIDPNTGLPYANDGSPYDPYGTAGYAPTYAGASPTPVQTSTQVTVNEAKPMTNREWYTQAVTALVHHHVTREHARRVLGEYLLMVPLTTDEIRIVEEAVRLVGPPPNPPRISHVPNRHPNRRTKH